MNKNEIIALHYNETTVPEQHYKSIILFVMWVAWYYPGALPGRSPPRRAPPPTQQTFLAPPSRYTPIVLKELIENVFGRPWSLKAKANYWTGKWMATIGFIRY
jgi:hypothetical protein